MAALLKKLQVCEVVWLREADHTTHRLGLSAQQSRLVELFLESVQFATGLHG